MITHFSNNTNVWEPEGFDAFSAHYPSTQWAKIKQPLNATGMFQSAWHEQTRLPRELAIVLTPGLFAEWLPQCFKGALKAFSKQGYRCIRTPVSTRYSIQAQAQRIEHTLQLWLNTHEQFIWCTHSKGGIDALWALDSYPMLRDRCIALVLVQPPIGHSWVIEDMRCAASWGDRAVCTAMNSRWLRDGLNTISKNRSTSIEQWLGTHRPAVPILNAVSWSIKATSWADSWHKRLSRIRPLHAHDGQFFLNDQRFRNSPTVCLPRLDHSQPVLGGDGVDTGRLWQALAYTALSQSQAK